MVFLIEHTFEVGRCIRQVCFEEKVKVETLSIDSLEHLPNEPEALFFIEGDYSQDDFLKKVEPFIEKKMVIVAIATHPLTLSRWLFIKQQCRIFLLIEAPILSFEIRSTLRLSQSLTSRIDSEPLDHFNSDSLNQQYEETFAQKLEKIERLASSALSLNEDAMRQFQKELKILTKTALAHRYFIISLLSHLASELAPPHFTLLIPTFVLKMRSGFQLRDVGADFAIEIKDNILQLPFEKILLIDENDEFTFQLKDWAQGCGLQVRSCTFEEVCKLNFKVEACLVFLIQPQEEEDKDFILKIKEIKENIEAKKWGVISSSKLTLPQRLQLLDLGSSCFFNSSLPPEDFIKSFNQMLLFFQELTLSPIVATFGVSKETTEHVKDISAQLIQLTHLDDLLKTSSQKYDLLILEAPFEEIVLPQLLQLLRSDYRYFSLPIWIVCSGEIEYSLPIDENLAVVSFSLVSDRLSQFIRKKRDSLQQEHDHLTGPFREEKLFELIKSGISAKKGCLAVLQIQRLSIIEREKGIETKEKLFFQLGHYLKKFFPPNVAIIRMRRDQFVLMMPDLDLELAEAKLNLLCYNLEAHFKKLQSAFPLGFNRALFSFPEQGVNLEELYFKAEEKIQRTLIEQVDNKEVFFIDPDEALLEILEQASKARGIQITYARNSQKAWEILTKRSSHQLPALLLLERLLGDGDGIDLIRKVQSHVPNQKIPFCFLTYRNSGKDAIAGLREGALDYISKPFNLEILIEKIIGWIKRGC